MKGTLERFRKLSNCFNKFTNSHYEDFDVFMFHTYLFMTLCFECKTATEEL